MDYGIGRSYKLIKKHRKRLDNTLGNAPADSTPSYSYGKLNENTDITSKKSLTAETHYRKIFALDDNSFVIIQNESASNPYSKDMLI